MRKLYIFPFFFLFVMISFAQSNRTDLVSSSTDETFLNFTFESYTFEAVETPQGEAFVVEAEDLTAIMQQGAPDLPKYTESIIIPDLSAMQIDILSSKFTDVQNVSIAPSKGNLTRDVDPSTVPYEYGEAYTRDSFFPGNLTALNSPYIMRDYRGQAVQVFPFQYNPVAKTLRVYSEIKLRIYTKNNDGVNQFDRIQDFDSLSKEFDKIYENHFINYTAFQSRYTPLEEEGNMLIICHDAWTAEVEPLVTWKNTIGRPCEMVTVTDAGGTAANIKTYIENYYNTNGLTYVLLIGDAAQVPTNSGGGLGGDSDNAYGYIIGSDHYQELFVGRFSAEDAAQVMTQVTRTLEYEKGDQLATGWLNKLMSVGSSEGAGQGDDGEADWEHLRNIQTDLLGFTYVGPPYEHFQGSQGGDDAPGDPSSSDVALSLNTGLSIVNYTGHGSTNSWSTSGFSSSNVNSLTNGNKLPFIWSVACVNGNFNGQSCFGEAWMRAENNTEPTGAIGIMASTINQSWAPPMSAQDEMVDLLVGASTNGTKRTFAGLSINGCFLMNDEYSDFAMTDTWVCFGDPSLYVRTDDPVDMIISHNSVIVVGETVFNVACDLEDALATVSLDGEIIGTTVVSAGNAAIPVSGLVPGTQVTLAVVGFNKVTYLTDVDVIAPSGSYLVVDSYGDAVTFGQTTNLDIALKNVGVDDAVNATATATTTDPDASFTNPTYAYGTIAAGSTSSPSSGAFSLTVSDDLPDQYMVEVALELSDDTNTWNVTKFVTVNAPEFTVENLTIDDTTTGNGDSILDPGETADISIQTANSGHAAITNVIGAITSSSSNLTLNSVTTTPIDLNTGESQDFVFNVTANSGTPEGTLATIDYTVTGGVSNQYSNTKAFEIVIGFVPEYCEAGSDNTSDEFIQQVVMMDIDNTSIQGPGYSDYTNISTNVEQGFSYEITIINGESYSSDQMGCWVDWNYDGDFTDSGEEFAITYAHNVPSTGLGTGTGSILVPNDARLGTARMRVRVLYSGGVSPCGNTSYGEVEDYTLNVNGPLGISSYDVGNFNIYPNPNQGVFTVDLSNMSMTDSAWIEVFNSHGQIIFQSKTSNSKMDVSLRQASGVYFVRITSGNQILNKKLLIN